MPELPETETIARDLHASVCGARIVAVEVHRADVLRGVTADALREHVVGLTIASVWRRAKLIVIDVARGTAHGGRTDQHRDSAATAHLVVQPRFTGALLVDAGTLPEELREYLTVSFALHDGRVLHYRDVRRLGTVAWMTHEAFGAYSDGLGPEPLAEDFSAAALHAALGESTRAIKAALMDQSRLAGVGNIYATESLWESRIDPSRSVRSLRLQEWERLHAALQRILRASIEARGTSFRDYRDASGGRGGFVTQLNAYGREGQPCTRCGRRLIGTHAVDGRMTVFCAGCQR